MTTAVDSLDAPVAAPTAAAGFGHRLAPPGDPLEGAAFDAVYQAKIEPELIKCEAERRSAMKAFLLALAAGAMLVFLEYLLTPSFTGGRAQTPNLGIVVATLVAAAILGYMPLAGVAKQAKVGVIQALCEPLGVAYTLTGREAPAWDDFLRLHLLPHPDDKTFQDFFSGRRGGTDFELCEAVLTRGSGKNRTTVFHGQLLRLSAARSRASTTVVLRNSGWLNHFECPSGLASIGLEDPNFNHIFAVFGSDQVEAREILTPSFMQQLCDLESAYHGGHVRCAFSATELLIALEGPNRFEIGNMFTSLVDRARVEGIARSLEQVFKMIDQFERP